MLSPCCLCIPPYQPRMAGPVFMKLGMNIMAPEPISTVYLKNPSHQSVYLYVCPSIFARQRLGIKGYRGNEYTRNRRIVGCVVFYAVLVV
jgi:hypothetical protein